MSRHRVARAIATLGAAALAAAVAALAPRPDVAAATDRRGPATATSLTPTAAFDHAGRLWVTWVDGPHVFAAASDDRGQSFAPAVEITRSAENIDANGEARPKIAVGTRDELYVSWTRKGAKPFTGDIRFARSVDGGRTFSAPVTVNDDGAPIGHRFDALRVSPGGTIYLAWIDKRDRERAAPGEHAHEGAAAGGHVHEGSEGAALYYSLSRDGGRSFIPNRRLKDGICECCRLAMDVDGDLPVLLWRDIFDGTVRDHALVRFATPDAPGPVVRASDDGWAIDACPHHGPSLSVSDAGTYHAVWFTGGGRRGAGAFYARSVDRGQTFPAPIPVGSDRTFGHAVVLSRGREVVLAWEEGVAQGMSVRVSRSRDDGVTWAASVEAARTAGRSDHPQLLSDGSAIYLSWFPSTAGLRVMPMDGLFPGGS